MGRTRHTSALPFAGVVALMALGAGGVVLGHGELHELVHAFLVVPVALCAVRFERRGGLIAGAVAVAASAAWDMTHGPTIAAEVVTWLCVYSAMGLLLSSVARERRTAETRLGYASHLSPDIICVADQNGMFHEVNEAATTILGYSRAELTGAPFVSFVHPDDRERTLEEAALLTPGGGSVRFQNRYLTKNGEYVWLQWNSEVDPVTGLVYANARDVTSQRLTELALESHSQMLRELLEQRQSELAQSRLETLRRLALAAEYRDDDTHHHTQRVAHTSYLLARNLGLDEQPVAMIRDAAPFHDVGKVGVSDALLLKPGKLSPEEVMVMQTHTTIGHRILSDSESPILQAAAEIALTHHENWDGSGYPNRTAGEAIPISGRIVAVADVFDALINTRPYKPSWPIAKAVAEIRRLAGSKFDPAVVEAFVKLDHEALVPASHRTARGDEDPLRSAA
jgi:PAS domain S-box-containing protein